MIGILIFLIKLGFLICDPLFFNFLFGLFHDVGEQMINSFSAGVIAFESITVWKAPTSFHYTHSARSLSTKPILFVFTFHHVFSEAAFHEIEVQGVKADKFWKQHIFELVFSFKTISKHETTSLTGVSMEVYVDEQI